MTGNIGVLATLPQLRIRQTLKNSDTADDQRMLAKLRAATNEIERFTGKQFQPVIETRTFDWTSTSYVGFRSQTALQITSVVDGQQRTISTTAMLPMGATGSTFGTTIGPFYGVEVVPAQGDFLTYLYTKRRAIAVAGTWGWHNDFANAWCNSGVTVQNSPLSSGATTITTSTNDQTITDAFGRNWNITQPVVAQYGTIHVGNLIQIDTEWMQVVGVPNSTSLTVIRGVHGTTAASHVLNSVISTYVVPADVNDIAINWASRLYYQDSTGSGGNVSMKAFGRGTKPEGDAFADLKLALEPYVTLRVA